MLVTARRTSHDLVDSFVFYELLDPYAHRLEGVNGDIPIHGRGAVDVMIEPELQSPSSLRY